MGVSRLRSVLTMLGLATALAVPLGLAGCKSEGSFSAEEQKQIKEGPPAEMPQEARKAMDRMGQGGGRVPPTPPRPKGQPGPGAPFGTR